MNDKIKVTNSEWYVMNCLWTAEQSLPLMQIVPLLKQSNGWSKSTSATMVRRMSEKGLIGYNEQGKTKYFFPKKMLLFKKLKISYSVFMMEV